MSAHDFAAALLDTYERGPPRSYSHIHRRNLIAVGILPLTLGDREYEDAREGQRWRIPGLAAAVAEGAEIVSAEVDGDQHIQPALALTPNERAVLAAGGLIAHIRSGGRSPVPA
jgi:aconitate hydratase